MHLKACKLPLNEAALLLSIGILRRNVKLKKYICIKLLQAGAFHLRKILFGRYCTHRIEQNPRHTNATLQIAGGVPITTVAKRLGHTTPNTTGKVYAHFIKSADEAAAETLEDLLAPTKNRNAG